MKFAGVAASGGVGLGPVLRVEVEELAVRDTPIAADAVDAEIARFRTAIARSREDLVSLRDRIARELGDDEAGIYDAHLLILEDPMVIGAVEEAIRREHRNAAWLLRAEIARYAARFEAIPNDYLRERGADVHDVEHRVLEHLVEGGRRTFTGPQVPSILVAHDLAPSQAALLDRDRVLGFVTEVGSRTSHCAIVARGRGIPAVVGCRGILQHARDGVAAALDGFTGTVELEPDESMRSFFVARREQAQHEDEALAGIRDLPAQTVDGRRIDLGANIELPAEVERIALTGADGIGLFRTEFFYLNRPELPSEQEQYDAYRRVVERISPVIFRTMDLGGDKVASYLGASEETNPFLGRRGIRFALEHPDIFRTQLRAIYRASAHGEARMMFPMVSNQDELLRANALCAEVRAELAREGVPHDPALEIGLMIETPSSVWMADVLARDSAFFSIGTNDLTQYTLAMDRDNERLAHLYEPLDPSILRSIRHTLDAGHAQSHWVGVCGEMAGDPRTAVLLVGMGVDELSMSSFDLPRVKSAIRSVRYEDAERAACAALAQATAADVKHVMSEILDPLLPSFLTARKVPA